MICVVPACDGGQILRLGESFFAERNGEKGEGSGGAESRDRCLHCILDYIISNRLPHVLVLVSLIRSESCSSSLCRG